MFHHVFKGTCALIQELKQFSVNMEHEPTFYDGNKGCLKICRNAILK